MRARARHRRACAATVALSALALAGCGLGAGDRADDVSLRVTDGFGSVTISEPKPLKQDGADTVMRLLQRNARVDTRYGGGFVQSIDGRSGGTDGGKLTDWFFYVNGILTDRGGVDWLVREGDRIWWDRHRWDIAQVGAVIGQYPAPMSSGHDGKWAGALLDCRTTDTLCDSLDEKLAGDGIEVQRGEAHRRDSAQTRIVVGSWRHVRTAAPELRTLSRGPEQSGVFAEIDDRSGRVSAADVDGRVRPAEPGAALIAAMRHGDRSSPVWVLTGPDEAAVARAVSMLGAQTLASKMAAIVPQQGAVRALPQSEGQAPR